MKKLLAMLLALVMLFAFIPATLADDADFTMIINGHQVAGEVLKVDVTLKSDLLDPIFGMHFALNYDSTQLKFESCEVNDVLGIAQVNGETAGTVRVGTANMGGFVVTSDMKAITLYFTIVEGLEANARIAFTLAEGAYIETGDVTAPVEHGSTAKFSPFIFFPNLLNISEQPVKATVKFNEKAKFTVQANALGELTYQWYYSKDNGATWTKYSGKTTDSISVKGTATTNGYLYRCVVKSGNFVLTSKSAKLTVSGLKPKIVVQPKKATVENGEVATFKVVAAGTGLKYQWYYSKDNGAKWVKWSGKTKASVKVTAKESNNGTLYRCVIKNTKGSVTTSKVRMTVNGVKPRVMTQPKAVTVAAGKTAKFTVAAAGVKPTYQWQVSKDGGKKWTNVKDATSTTLSFKTVKKNNGWLYRCVITNEFGSVNSKGVKLTIK